MVKTFGDKITDSLGYPARFIKGRVKKSDVKFDEIKSGEGAVVELDGKKTAVYKNEKGEVTKLSPVCTHLGCIVGWNNADKTWDCPCHGSRFEANGALKQGPAKRDLDSSAS